MAEPHRADKSQVGGIRARSLAALAALALLGCGENDSGGRGGDTAGGCEPVGEIAKATDGGGDVRPNVRVPPPPPAPPGLDLEGVALARSDSEICVEWTVDTPVRPRTVFDLSLRQADGGNSGGLVGISVLVFPGGAAQIQLSYPGADDRADGGRVEGTAIIEGRRVLMRLERALLPDYLSLDRFEWDARTGAQPERLGAQYSDCTPERGHVGYPGGGIVALEYGANCY